MKPVSIAATGAYLPARCVTNHELAERLPDTSDEWISTNTGIRTRHLIADDEAVSDMAAAAAKKALENAGVSPDELGMIFVATCTPDYRGFPSTACIVQDLIDAPQAASLDISAACSGFVYGLEVAKGYAQIEDRPILLIGAEAMSRVVDWNDYKTCVLFGDGAGAVVLNAGKESDEPTGILDSFLGADGSSARVLYVEGGTRQPASDETLKHHVLTMDGKRVFNFAVKSMVQVIEHFLAKHELKHDDVKYVIPHQANKRIIDFATKRTRIPQERFYINLDKVANTSGASIPLALAEMDEKGLLQRGDLIITVGFGAGLTFGGNLIRW